MKVLSQTGDGSHELETGNPNVQIVKLPPSKG